MDRAPLWYIECVDIEGAALGVFPNEGGSGDWFHVRNEVAKGGAYHNDCCFYVRHALRKDGALIIGCIESAAHRGVYVTLKSGADHELVDAMQAGHATPTAPTLQPGIAYTLRLPHGVSPESTRYRIVHAPADAHAPA